MVFDLTDISTYNELTGEWASGTQNLSFSTANPSVLEVTRYAQYSNKIVIGNKADCPNWQVDSSKAEVNKTISIFF